MKRNLKIRWGFGLLLALLASCSQSDDGTSHTADRQISFTGIVHPSTRATESAFEDEDEISVFAFKEGAGGFTSDSYATNVRYQYMDGKFQAVGQGIIYPQEQSLAFWAIYPYCESAAPAFTFDVQEDQRKVLNYSHSDLMTASTNNTTSTTPSLAFNHRLSCVTVNLTFEDTNSKAAQLNFTYVQKSASVNMTEATFRGIGEAVSTIRATPNGAGRFKVILPPQTIAQGTEFVEVTTEAVTEPAKTYRWKVPKDLVWVSGSRYTYNLNVSKVGEITFTSEINPWEEDEEIELGGKLVVRASGSSGYSTFIHRPTEEAESFLVDTCYEYSDFGVDGPFFELYIGNYSPEQHLYTGIDCWISNASMGYPVFTGRNEGEPGDVSAKLNREGMNMRVSLSGRGDLTTSSQVTIPANIVSGEYLLPLSFVGTMKKNIQSISELNFPDVAFELPVPVDEAMVITEGGKYTRGGDLYYREGSLARYEEMKQKMETAGFILQEEENPSGNEWRDGVWMKENVLIIMYFDSQGMETIISGGTDYHLSIAVVEVSRSTARSANSFAPHMNRMKKLRLR